jgi:hypothetical protein
LVAGSTEGFANGASARRRGIVVGDRMHLVWRQLRGYGAHLFIDIVLADVLGESRELALDISRVLALQRGSSDRVCAGTMTG